MKWTRQEYSIETTVSPLGAQVLERMASWLELVANLTQCTSFFIVQGRELDTLHISAYATPIGVKKMSLLDIPWQRSRETIVSQVFEKGTALFGKKETKLGKFEDFYAAPLLDNTGGVLAVLGLLGQIDDHLKTLVSYMPCLFSLTESSAQELTLQDGVVLFDADGHLLYQNELGQRLYAMLASESSHRWRLDERTELDIILQAAKVRHIVTDEWRMETGVLHGKAIPLSENGQIVAVLLLLRDVTLLREKEHEILVKNMIIREVHHRVKNNLQTIASLLRLQGRRSSQEVRQALKETEHRLQAISLIHDILASETTDVASVETMLLSLIDNVHREWAPTVQVISNLSSNLPLFPSQVLLSLGMIVHELLQNACEHAQQAADSTVTFTFLQDGGGYLFTVTNAVNPDVEMNKNSSHLGLEIVRSLMTMNLQGTFSFEIHENKAIAQGRFYQGGRDETD